MQPSRPTSLLSVALVAALALPAASSLAEPTVAATETRSRAGVSRATERDLRGISRIERDSFSQPWSHEALRRELPNFSVIRGHVDPIGELRRTATAKAGEVAKRLRLPEIANKLRLPQIARRIRDHELTAAAKFGARSVIDALRDASASVGLPRLAARARGSVVARELGKGLRGLRAKLSGLGKEDVVAYAMHKPRSLAYELLDGAKPMPGGAGVLRELAGQLLTEYGAAGELIDVFRGVRALKKSPQQDYSLDEIQAQLFYLKEDMNDELSQHDLPLGHYVSSLATHPGARRRGHGTKLLEHAEAKARERGAPYIFLHVRESNTGARTLYQDGQHYQPVAKIPGFYGEEAAILMVKPLSDAPAKPAAQ